MDDSPAPGTKGGEPLWSSLKEGFRLCRRDNAIMGVLGLACAANMFGFPLIHALLPVFAKQVLGVGPAELGLLGGAIGTGAFVGSLLLAWKGSRVEGNTFIWVSFLLWYVTLILFAVLPYFGASLFLLFAIGCGQALAMVTTTTYLLHRAAPEMRGRIMGIRGLAIISLFLGNLVGGALTGWLGAPTALVIFGGGRHPVNRIPLYAPAFPPSLREIQFIFLWGVIIDFSNLIRYRFSQHERLRSKTLPEGVKNVQH